MEYKKDYGSGRELLVAVQQQIGSLPEQIASLCKQLQQESDGKIRELAGEVKASLRERDDTNKSQFEELKALIDTATSAKTRRVAAEL